MAPTVMRPNQPPNRFYRGGAQISTFRKSALSGVYEPEDWVASTTCCHGQDTLGLSRLDDGTLLVGSVRERPEYWLSPEHIRAFGDDTRLLVKLLDAGQRLPVHAHPHRNWAQSHLGCKHGKAELWFVLQSGPIWLGLREDISFERLKNLVETQQTETLLNCMHQLHLEPGQAIYVPPGVLHAIGAGMLIAEVQEPSDLSVLCEWQGFAIDGAKYGHLGLGFDVALTAVETRGRTRANIEALMTDQYKHGPVGSLQAQKYFRAERHDIEAETSFAAGFAILIVFSGEMQLKLATGSHLSLQKGMTVVVPYADGDFMLQGSGSIFIARPPQSARAL